MERGMVHLYCGDGKGKTTAAMGLALRALGAGMRVAVVQFLKDGHSSELAPLEKLGAAVFSGGCGSKFVFQMDQQEKEETRRQQDALLRRALAEPCDLLVQDEACAACSLGMVDQELLRGAVQNRPAGCEVVLTGRDPAEWMQNAADYITEMRAVRHPFEKGVAARRGVDF